MSDENLPLLSVLISLTMFSDDALQQSSAFSDSTHTKSGQWYQFPNQENGFNQKNVFTYPYQKSKSECIATPNSLPDNMKIYKPDTTLTSSMPVITPALVDPEIFIPGLGCTEPHLLHP